MTVFARIDHAAGAPRTGIAVIAFGFRRPTALAHFLIWLSKG
jgi:hypothetical protein